MDNFNETNRLITHECEFKAAVKSEWWETKQKKKQFSLVGMLCDGKWSVSVDVVYLLCPDD